MVKSFLNSEFRKQIAESAFRNEPLPYRYSGAPVISEMAASPTRREIHRQSSHRVGIEHIKIASLHRNVLAFCTPAFLTG